jgi:Na+-transporting NADH:ubiquinone oxidoreductase subunit C
MNERTYTVFYMVLVCVIATALLTGAKLLFTERIQRNEEVRTQVALLRGLGIMPEKADAKAVQEAFRSRVARTEKDGMTLYYAYGPDGKQIETIGFIFQGQGFWGPIRGIIAVKPDLATVAGFEVIAQQETPGLGARVTEPAYKQQFVGKAIGEKTADGIYLDLVSADVEKLGPHQIHAITGATRTSDSLRKMLNEDIGAFRDLAAKTDLIAEAPAPGGG